MACPGSVRLSVGLPNPSSSHADEGTAAHMLAEWCLADGIPCDDRWLGSIAGDGVEVTDEIIEYVKVYVDYCSALKGLGLDFWVEKKFNLDDLDPPAEMFGTADFVAYDAAEERLHVVDFKSGSGVVVEAEGNPQLRYYALGASLGLYRPIQEVVMTIVQPRAQRPDGPIRSETIPWAELVGFAGDLLEAARRALEPDAPLVPGKHCRWCLASAICPARREEAQSIAQVEFAAMPLDVPPTPETLPVSVLSDMMTKLPILEDWIRAMYSHAQALLERGEEVPGFKLVQKRATRKWKDEESVEHALNSAGYTDEEIYTRDLDSPAQIEKLVGGKKKFEEKFGHLVVKKSSGVTLAPDTDPRPAANILAPGEEFAALPSGE